MSVEKKRTECQSDLKQNTLSFTLIDYRNNYFMSNDPKKIIEFYNGFDNPEDLIQWMKERPKGVATIHEVEGDKDIIVVIPTSDFNGKFATECKEKIFKGLHMIFVQSAKAPDLYFNYAHNCNVGIRKAMEYGPKWVIVSNDDMKPERGRLFCPMERNNVEMFYSLVDYRNSYFTSNVLKKSLSSTRVLKTVSN